MKPDGRTVQASNQFPGANAAPKELKNDQKTEKSGSDGARTGVTRVAVVSLNHCAMEPVASVLERAAES